MQIGTAPTGKGGLTMAEAEAWVMIPKLRDITDDEVNMVLDMHPLVLCKDCKHGRLYDCGRSVDCEFNELAKEPNFFCADGERRNESE